jgi:hypothetical protein
LAFTFRTRIVKDLTQYEVVDDSGGVVETFPPGYGDMKGHTLRQFVINRVSELNSSSGAALGHGSARESRETDIRMSIDDLASYTTVFKQLKCLRCRGPVYDYPKGAFCSASHCGTWFVRPERVPT